MRKDQPYLILTCLNEDLELGNYPTTVTTEQSIILHFSVTSYWDEEIEVQVRHIRGKNSSVSVGSTGSINGTLLNSFNRTLQVSEEWISAEINTSFSEPLNLNEHYLIIFELWVNIDSKWEYMSDQIVYIRLNATSI